MTAVCGAEVLLPNTSVPMFLDIGGSESCPVGLVWSGADRFLSFPYLSFLILADFPQIQTRQTESGKHLDFMGGGPFF